MDLIELGVQVVGLSLLPAGAAAAWQMHESRPDTAHQDACERRRVETERCRRACIAASREIMTRAGYIKEGRVSQLETARRARAEREARTQRLATRRAA